MYLKIMKCFHVPDRNVGVWRNDPSEKTVTVLCVRRALCGMHSRAESLNIERRAEDTDSDRLMHLLLRVVVNTVSRLSRYYCNVMTSSASKNTDDINFPADWNM
jgi:hypothetical protein